jgi:hypothetical protein
MLAALAPTRLNRHKQFAHTILAKHVREAAEAKLVPLDQCPSERLALRPRVPCSKLPGSRTDHSLAEANFYLKLPDILSKDTTEGLLVQGRPLG